VVTVEEVAAGFSVLVSWWRKAKRRPATFFSSYLDLCILTQQNFKQSLSPNVQTDFTGVEQATLGGDLVSVRVVDDVGPGAGGPADVSAPDPRQVSFDGGQWPLGIPGMLDLNHLNDCAGVWKGDKGGAKRPIGCGDRVLCPLCSDYYHATQAREGIAMVGSVLDGADAMGVSRDTWGEHIEVTLPKEFSAALDLMLTLDYDCYRNKVNKLRQAAWRCIKKAVARACKDAGLPGPGELGGVIVFHHWGSSAPWKPHYHFHVYLLPYTADSGHDGVQNWRALPRWWSEDSLALLRSAWKKASERILDSHYGGEWNVHRGYLDKKRQMLHFMAYQMRAPMRDLWKGVRADGSGGFEYHAKGKPGRPGKISPIGPDDFRVAAGRTYLVGAKLTRITWYGLLANASQAKTMKRLGLLRVEDESDEGGDMSSNKAKYWRPVDQTDVGVLFQATDGSGEVDFVAWDKLKPDPVAGLCDKAIGARRRHRWILAGADATKGGE